MSPRLLITRTADDCLELAERLRPRGWQLVPYPVLRLVPVDHDPGWVEVERSWRSDRPPTWIVVTSPRGPAPFVQGALAHGLEDMLGLPVAAVGTGTAEAVLSAGLAPRLIGPGTGAGLAQALNAEVSGVTTLVLVLGRDHRPELSDGLEAAGHRALPVTVYAMEAAPPGTLPPPDPACDAVLLTSPRAAQLYVQHSGGQPLPCPHWALGPTTGEAARELGIECRLPPAPKLESFAEELCPT